MDLGQLNLNSLPIGTFVMLFLYLIIGAYTIFTGILYYHWKTYAADNKVSGITLILYFSSTIPLLIAMGITAFLIV